MRRSRAAWHRRLVSGASLPGLLKFVNMKSRRLPAASGGAWSRAVVVCDLLRPLLKDGWTIFCRRSSARTIRNTPFPRLAPLEIGSGRCRTSALAALKVSRGGVVFTFAHSDYRQNSHSYSRYAREILSARFGHRLPFRTHDSRSARSRFENSAWREDHSRLETRELARRRLYVTDNRGWLTRARRCNPSATMGMVTAQWEAAASESAREDQRSDVCTKLAAERDWGQGWHRENARGWRGCRSTCTLHGHIPPNECTRHVRGILCSPPSPPPPPPPSLRLSSTTGTTREPPPLPPSLSNLPSHTTFVRPPFVLLSSPDRHVLRLASPANHPLSLSLSSSLPLRRALGAPSRVEPPFRAPPDSASATQTRAGSRVRRGAVLPRMAETPAALLGLCPVFASSCVPADVLCTRRLVRTTHPPVRGSSLLCTCTRLLTPSSLPRSYSPCILGEHATPSSFRKLSPPSPLFYLLFLPLVYAVSFTSCSLLLATSVTEVSRSSSFGPRVYLCRTMPCSGYSSLDVAPAAAYSALTAGNVAEVRRAGGCRLRVSSTSAAVRSAKYIPCCSTPKHSP